MKTMSLLSMAAAAYATQSMVIDYGNGNNRTISVCDEAEYAASKFTACQAAENCIVGR